MVAQTSPLLKLSKTHHGQVLGLVPTQSSQELKAVMQVVSLAVRRNLVIGATVSVGCDMLDRTHAHIIVDSIMQRTHLQHMIIDICASMVEDSCCAKSVVEHVEMSTFAISPTVTSSKRSFV